MVKSLKMSAVGLDIISSTRERIKKNYRNSKQILQAAALLANKYVEKAQAQGEDIELLNPELADRETSKPKALEVQPGQELVAAWKLAADCLSARTAVPWSVNIATASPTKLSVDDIIAAHPGNCPCKVDRITGDYTRSKDTLTVGTTSDVKGFEFSMIIIVGCGKDKLPAPGHCTDETWREALRLYVAITRGRDQVYLIYSGEPSEFLRVMEPGLSWESQASVEQVKA
jgi:superfamily I DNA/RNA helicase